MERGVLMKSPQVQKMVFLQRDVNPLVDRGTHLARDTSVVISAGTKIELGPPEVRNFGHPQTLVRPFNHNKVQYFVAVHDIDPHHEL